MNIEALQKLVEEHKQGAARGMYSVCSANRYVIEACMQQAAQDGSALLVESTSNQVNQFGGYTGMTPAGFAGYLHEIAAKMGFPAEKILLGGDHLGPNPWQAEAESGAMEKARRLVQECIQAGYAKVHLDASMYLKDDDSTRPLDPRTVAGRAADLCLTCEQACQDAPDHDRPVYVIGTEVPPPGGAQEKGHAPRLTRVVDALETIELTRQAFQKRGIEAAWERVIALVVQPGVEFGDQEVYEYDRAQAAGLSRFIESIPGLVYEAHSTDYQTRQSLRQMVEDHFAILKVGPGLTYAFREAVFALAMVEKEWLAERPGVRISGLIEAVDQAMRRDPRYWKSYYRGEAATVSLARKYSYSDRVRYYWTGAEVTQALDLLLQNLESSPPPLTLIGQYLPGQYKRLRAGQIENRPAELIHDRIREVAQGYAWACGAP